MASVLIDCGEHPGESEQLWALADVLCCACGGHAGDDTSMARVAAFCLRAGVRLAAHPSYADSAGFGRQSPLAAPGFDAASLTPILTEQCAALERIARDAGVIVTTVKPHGALYHDAAAHHTVAVAVLDAAMAVVGPAVTIIGPARGALRDEADRRGLPYLREGFADRRMRPDGSLVPRGEAGAVIEDPAEAAGQAARLRSEYDVICVHADSPAAEEIARAVRNVLLNSGAQGLRSAGPSASAEATADHRSLARRWSGPAGLHEKITWVRLGDRAIRFPRPAGPSARALLDHLRTWPGVKDVVVAREDVALYFEGEPGVEQGAIDGLTALRAPVDEPRTIVIPAVYEGPDLADVARASGLTEAEVIATHVIATYEVETIGFAPGFAYLTGLDSRLHLPRHATPRARVPAGSVALAGGYTGVYPFDTPGGWHIIGRVASGIRMFDEHGARLRLGDRVRFVR